MGYILVLLFVTVYDIAVYYCVIVVIIGRVHCVDSECNFEKVDLFHC